MAIVLSPERSSFFVSETEMERLRQLAREVNEKAGIKGEPTMSLEELHQSMRTHGVRPEDNGASRELLRMRYGDDYTQDEE